jgi:hypothetical protein
MPLTMATTVSELTTEQLRELIENAVEQKLFELLGDPDEGLELKAAVRRRLLHQQKKVAAGERGASLEEVARRLEL